MRKFKLGSDKKTEPGRNPDMPCADHCDLSFIARAVACAVGPFPTVMPCCFTAASAIVKFKLHASYTEYDRSEAWKCWTRKEAQANWLTVNPEPAFLPVTNLNNVESPGSLLLSSTGNVKT